MTLSLRFLAKITTASPQSGEALVHLEAGGSRGVPPEPSSHEMHDGSAVAHHS
jgi:hypothetical protein